jgi:hypothetical protein
MSPEEIKLNYFFDEPSNKIKSEPEYLQYSEEDDCYSELTPDADIQNADMIQNATLQSDEHHENDQKVDVKADHSIHSKPNKKSNDTNTKNADEHIHYKFYGIVKDGDFLIESDFD